MSDHGLSRSGNRADVREFLISRRARISPEQVSLPVTGRRRVPGLRREEVAMLAGVSVDWYTRLEKGHISGVSQEVLEAVARVLRLDDEERVYLFDLAHAARPARRTPAAAAPLPPNVQWLLDSMTLSTAMVTNERHDVLAANPLARALYAPLFGSATTRESGHANLVRYHFLDPGARDFYGDWNLTADMLVASLRTEAGRNPHDIETRGLVGELTTASADFRARWNTHNILIHVRGTKLFRHPEAGRLSLSYYSLGLPVSVGETRHMCVCTAEPGSADEDKLTLLASLAASPPHQADAAEPDFALP
ncbi:helix-turn-helix transcriptional regulator [Saccharothrix coeruleofusca]|uniref:Transcriptional regulator n=1 Tax=Saccharothrix coeruleofusca TaxID=33919 RepID=A0A918EGE5_9PSEU|nr:helix-turn-helix transcriptional regulator [Saccharothrix coeruleofusca]GGP81377.1 transcriptional regulator [Saccharothrix coeruleofusca]